MVEMLIVLAIGSAVLALTLNLLAADAVQSRRLIDRNDRASDNLLAHRLFRHDAGLADGAGNSTRVGPLAITGRSLVTIAGDKPRTLLQWRAGVATFSYSSDGQSWTATTQDAAKSLVRFSLRDEALQVTWIAP